MVDSPVRPAFLPPLASHVTDLQYFLVYYGDGSSTSGPIYTDVMQMGEFYDDKFVAIFRP